MREDIERSGLTGRQSKMNVTQTLLVLFCCVLFN